MDWLVNTSIRYVTALEIDGKNSSLYRMIVGHFKNEQLHSYDRSMKFSNSMAF